MNKAEKSLRRLMKVNELRYDKLERARKEAKKENDVQHEMTIELMQRQHRVMEADLFDVMKECGMLDEEEMLFGGIKKVKEV